MTKRVTFVCAGCSYTAPVPAGGGWSICPKCGGDQVGLLPAEEPAVRPAKAEKSTRKR